MGSKKCIFSCFPAHRLEFKRCIAPKHVVFLRAGLRTLTRHPRPSFKTRVLGVV